jgi:glycosyltransferase involved in cell wall biosynthesis
MAEESSPTAVTRVIARLNIGGPAIQAITLTRELERYGFSTHLIRGREDPSEGNMDYLASAIGVRPTLVSQMRRNPGSGDLMALAALVRLLRRDRPQLVHTHAAKAGTLGRVATVLAFPRRSNRPVVVHTYHGHSLTGYFSGRTAGFYRLIEVALARFSDRLIAVSDEIRSELVELRVAPSDHFEVVPLGFDLTPFCDPSDREARRERLRGSWGVQPEQLVVTLIARLVPIKRVDRFLAAARQVESARVRFVIVGDGELHDELQSNADAVALGDRLVWAGFRRDMPDVCFASDLVVLTSDNEGTPVSLIEAQAAGVPVVATDVGGVRAVVLDGISGLLSSVDDSAGLSAAITRLLDDPALRAEMARRGQEHTTRNFTLTRLTEDHARLYRRLLNERAQRGRSRT